MEDGKNSSLKQTSIFWSCSRRNIQKLLRQFWSGFPFCAWISSSHFSNKLSKSVTDWPVHHIYQMYSEKNVYFLPCPVLLKSLTSEMPCCWKSVHISLFKEAFNCELPPLCSQFLFLKNLSPLSCKTTLMNTIC